MNAVKEFAEIMTSEVPAALFCGIRKKRTKIGIAKKPPPTPKTPVIKPMVKETKTRIARGIFFWSPLRGLKSIDVAAKIRTNAKPAVIVLSERWRESIEPPKLVIRPSDQIVRASRIRTSRDLNFGTAPAAAARKTIARAAVDA